jgi:hypothetical protein
MLGLGAASRVLSQPISAAIRCLDNRPKIHAKAGANQRVTAGSPAMTTVRGATTAPHAPGRAPL